jgi:hypothetical protein
MLYAMKLARHCSEEEKDYCLEVKQPTDMNDQEIVCNPPIDLDKVDMYAIFRAYMEPATSVGPDDNELLWDRGIYFTTQ